MATNKPPENAGIDAKVLARRQKDLEGFIEKHQALLDERAVQYAAETAPLWQRIASSITKEIKAIYYELQDAQGVPITKQPIKADKLRNMKRQYARLRKLEQRLMEILGTKDHQNKMDRNLAYSYAESFYFHAFGLEKAAKVTVATPVLTIGHVIGALLNPWLPDGKTYSARIRESTAYLAKKMVETVENALGLGWSINRTAREIQQNAQEGYYNAVRLARTEMTRAAGQGANHLYMQNADILDGKRWNATLDQKTAAKDAQNDGEVFKLNYDTPENPGKAGKRIPNHPNCRCKWSPVLSALGISSKERIARDDNNKRTYTKARTYKEYAKERGLPDVSETVRNDNPLKYLRGDEEELAAALKRNYVKPPKKEYKEINGYKVKIGKGAQEKHIPGTPNYKQEVNNGKMKSILYGNVETAQELLEKYSGKGVFLPKRPNVERVLFDEDIGEFFDANGTKKYYKTSVGMIHYSKNKGAHIVPARPTNFEEGGMKDGK